VSDAPRGSEDVDSYDTGAVSDRPSAWVGWVLFAGVLIIMLGLFQGTMGLVALFDDGYFLVNRSGLLVPVDYTVWGWVHIILGVVAFVTGFGLLLGQLWARVTGIVLAVLSMLVNLAFFAAYPLWALVVIAFNVLTIYALAVHGGEVADGYEV
jgi:hypothetical protein